MKTFGRPPDLHHGMDARNEPKTSETDEEDSSVDPVVGLVEPVHQSDSDTGDTEDWYASQVHDLGNCLQEEDMVTAGNSFWADIEFQFSSPLEEN